jgi:hypothetical protein
MVTRTIENIVILEKLVYGTLGRNLLLKFPQSENVFHQQFFWVLSVILFLWKGGVHPRTSQRLLAPVSWLAYVTMIFAMLMILNPKMNLWHSHSSLILLREFTKYQIVEIVLF